MRVFLRQQKGVATMLSGTLAVKKKAERKAPKHKFEKLSKPCRHHDAFEERSRV
jgi:hypothetical protein